MKAVFHGGTNHGRQMEIPDHPLPIVRLSKKMAHSFGPIFREDVRPIEIEDYRLDGIEREVLHYFIT